MVIIAILSVPSLCLVVRLAPRFLMFQKKTTNDQ
jgi:hypothetical protein